MDRLQNTDLSATPPAATTGTTGYPRVSVPGGVTASAMHPYYLYMLIEELRAVVVAGSVTPAFTTLTQVQESIAAQITAATPAASETVSGIVELATSAETVTGTDAVRATTPAGVAAAIAAGIVGMTQAVTIITAATGNYTVPAGVEAIDVECVGVGGAGGINSSTGGGGGGGGGGYARKWYSVTAGQVIAYTISATATTFDTTLVANAGVVGTQATTPKGFPGGAGGTATGGDINISGGYGEYGFSDGADIRGGTGGSSHMGAGGTSGTAGQSYGGGGGGSITVTQMAGGPGAIIIREFGA